MEDEAGEVVTQLYDAVVRFTARMGEMTIRERSYCSFRMVYSGPAYAGLWSAMSEEETLTRTPKLCSMKTDNVTASNYRN